MKIYCVKPGRRNVRNKVMFTFSVFVILCMALSISVVIYSNMHPQYPDKETIEQMKREELDKVDTRSFIYDEQTGEYRVNTERTEIEMKYRAMELAAENSKVELSAGEVYGYITALCAIIAVCVKGRVKADSKDDNVFVKTDEGELYYLTVHNPQKTYRDTMFGYKPRKFSPKVTRNDLDVCRTIMREADIEKYLPQPPKTLRIHSLTGTAGVCVCRIDAVEHFEQKGGKIYFSFRTGQDYDLKLYGGAYSYMNDFNELSAELKKRLQPSLAS